MSEYKIKTETEIENTAARVPEAVHENKMGTMSMGKLIATMSWPAMLSMLIQALYNIVDSIFVAKISEAALTAVTYVFPIQMIIISVAVGTGVGINSLISRRLGEKRLEEANLAAGHGFRISFFSWIPFAVFGIFFSRIYMEAYSDSAFIVDNGTSYLSIVTIGSLFILIQVNLEKILQATGNMVLPMLCSLTGAIVNIVFDALLIFGLYGFPEMGVSGAAVATVFAQFCSLCLGTILFFGKKHAVSIKMRNFKYNTQIIKDIYSVALPSMLMQSISSILLFFLNGILTSLSDTHVAVMGAYFRINSFVFMPVFGLNQGLMPIMGYNYGARNKSRLIEAYKSGIEIAAVILIIGTLIFQLFPEQLLLLFSAEDYMMEIGIPALRIISFSFIFASFGILTSTFFQATGHGMLSLWQSLIRQLIGILPVAWIFVELGMSEAVWWSFPISEVAATIYCIIYVRWIYNNEVKYFD